MEKCRVHIVFAGMVQGVGFRFTACRIAESHDVTGKVRNVPDGTVDIVADGTRAQLTAFRDAILDRMAGYVRDYREEWLQPNGGHETFEVAF